MRKILLLWAALASLPLAAEPVLHNSLPLTAEPVLHNLAQGTPLVLSSLEALTPGETPEGQLTFRVERDVLAPDGTPVISRGSEALGHVVRSETASPFGHQNALEIQLDFVPAVAGHLVPLRATRARGDAFNRGLQAPLLLPRLASWTPAPDAPTVETSPLSSLFRDDDGLNAFCLQPGHLFSAFTHQDVAVVAPSRQTAKSSRKLRITSPESHAQQLQQEPLQVHFQLSPPDPEAIYRIYLDGQLVVTRQGDDPAPLPWNLQDHTRTTQPTLHTLQVEATDQMGRLTVSPLSYFQLRHSDAAAEL